MKKLPYFILLFSIFHSMINAQEIDFGVKVGPNLSTVSGDLTDNYEPRLGYHFGGFAEIPLSNRFSFAPELLYNSIGFILNVDTEIRQSFEEPGIYATFKSAERLNYLTIPLSFRFNFTPKFGLEFGPQTAFLLNSVSKLKEYEGFEPEDDKNSNPGDFRFDYGATLGLGYKLNTNFSVQLRYYHGFSDIFESRIGNFKNYNRVLQLSFGYIIF